MFLLLSKQMNDSFSFQMIATNPLFAGNPALQQQMQAMMPQIVSQVLKFLCMQNIFILPQENNFKNHLRFCPFNVPTCIQYKCNTVNDVNN